MDGERGRERERERERRYLLTWVVSFRDVRG